MVKRDPDDLLSTLSKHFKNNKKTPIRITFKRGGLWKSQFAKAHSRKAKGLVRQTLKKQVSQENTYPLIARVKTQQGRFNVQNKLNTGANFIQSALSIFRVNFFKQKAQNQEKVKKGPSKAKPDSKSTKKRIDKKKRNKERRLKRNQISRRQKKQKHNVNKT